MSNEKKSWLDRAGAVHLWKTIEAMLGTKVDKIEGFGLSSNDYTTEEKEKLATLADPDVATTENNGLMSSADKAKLDGIEAGANKSEEDPTIILDKLNPSDEPVADDTNLIVKNSEGVYSRSPLILLWNWIKAKADTLYAVVGHNHKVNELENYDTHVYNPTLNRTKRTVLAAPTGTDGPATFRTLDKNDVGLGNVDNVAALPLTGGTMSGQIKRSVNTSHIAARDGVPLSNPQTGTSYRPVVGVKSANGYWVMSTYNNDNLRFAYTSDADYSAGTNRETTVLLPSEAGTIITSATIGNQVVAGVKDCNSGTTSTFAYSKSGMNYGDYSQLAAWNGYELRAVNKNQFLKADGKAVSAGTADYASRTLFDEATTISAKDLNQNTWYPVVSTNTIPYSGLRHIKCNVQLNSGTKPSWSTHSAGFTVNLDMLVTACGWGTTSARSIVLDNSYQFIASGSSSPAGYSQMTNGSVAVFWVRGGGSYHIYSDQDAKWQLQTSTFTSNGQSVAPTTSYPGVSYNKATLDSGALSSYPVGSIYMSTSSTSPASIFGGSWQSIASERVLMGVSSSHGAGSTVSAGLPNITGVLKDLVVSGHFNESTGAFKRSSASGFSQQTSSSDWMTWADAQFYASDSNSIYGNASTVQPAAYYVYMWQRTG